MPAETFTYTTFDVYERVRSLFGDTSGAQITDQMTLRWINDGQQEIVNNNPILKKTKYSNIVADQSEYTFPTDAVQYIEAVYVDGRPIRAMTPLAFREFILDDDPTRAAEAKYPEVWYERVNYVMTQALELDENYTGAELKRSQFREGLDRQSLHENIVQIAAYPQVLADPDDYNV